MASSPRYPAGACAGAAPDWLCDGKLQFITQLVLERVAGQTPLFCDNQAAWRSGQAGTTADHTDITGSADPARRQAGSGARICTSSGPELCPFGVLGGRVGTCPSTGVPSPPRYWPAVRWSRL